MRYAIFMIVVVLLSACGKQDAGDEVTPRPEPIVVYADAPGEESLRAVFAPFTEATGIRVTIREADAAKNLDDILTNKGAPPADLLLTDNIADIWLAGDEGALRLLNNETGVFELADTSRDPDGYWALTGLVGLSVVTTQVVTSADWAPGLDALAMPEYKGSLCLATSSLPANRSLIAALIDRDGEREAEILVRKWMQNLALPPFGSTTALLDAVSSGTCRYAIVDSGWLDDYEFEPMTLSRSVLAEAYTAYGIGVARHARYPENAQKLVAWLLTSEGQGAFAAGAGATPVTSRSEAGWDDLPAATIGWLDEEARLLAERAHWR